MWRDRLRVELEILSNFLILLPRDFRSSDGLELGRIGIKRDALFCDKAERNSFSKQ